MKRLVASDALRKTIEIKALEFGIDPDLVEAMAMTESSGNPKATRYEPNFYKKYVQPMLTKNAISPKEAIGRATSWGLLQLMGQVAREKGFAGKFEELFEPSVNLTWALKHLKRFINKYPAGLDDAIASYNAGSPRRNDAGSYVNQAYVDRVHKFLAHLKGEDNEGVS